VKEGLTTGDITGLGTDERPPCDNRAPPPRISCRGRDRAEDSRTVDPSPIVSNPRDRFMGHWRHRVGRVLEVGGSMTVLMFDRGELRCLQCASCSLLSCRICPTESPQTHTHCPELPGWRHSFSQCSGRSRRANSGIRCALRSDGANRTHLVLVHVFPWCLAIFNETRQRTSRL
jgi:hypothetical protein